VTTQRRTPQTPRTCHTYFFPYIYSFMDKYPPRTTWSTQTWREKALLLLIEPCFYSTGTVGYLLLELDRPYSSGHLEMLVSILFFYVLSLPPPGEKTGTRHLLPSAAFFRRFLSRSFTLATLLRSQCYSAVLGLGLQILSSIRSKEILGLGYSVAYGL